jgi:hypothetical protein
MSIHPWVYASGVPSWAHGDLVNVTASGVSRKKMKEIEVGVAKTIW